MTDEPRALEKAQAIKAWLAEHPDQHELGQIVEGSGVDAEHARAILDSWRPDDSEAGVVFIGPGRGGPWLEAEPEGVIAD